MEKRNAKPPHEVVVPGELLDSDGARGGRYTYERDGKLYSSILGIKNSSRNVVSVVPINGCYVPSTGDTVIGIISDIGASNWTVDINAPYPAPLHVSEVPWKVEFGDTSRYLNIGDVVVLKVLMVDESRKIQVTMNDSHLRRLKGGQIVSISPSKVSRIIGKSGSTIQSLESTSGCRIFVGQNGRIWINGDDENSEIAAAAIGYIETNAQIEDLVEKIKIFVEKKLSKTEE
ncbi:MAG: exosome complex RNA-binding protein Rrp4 [archaeon]|nr:exosome complex RNA-binding protein Rrp4 [archaeon]